MYQQALENAANPANENVSNNKRNKKQNVISFNSPFIVSIKDRLNPSQLFIFTNVVRCARVLL